MIKAGWKVAITAIATISFVLIIIVTDSNRAAIAQEQLAAVQEHETSGENRVSEEQAPYRGEAAAVGSARHFGRQRRESLAGGAQRLGRFHGGSDLFLESIPAPTADHHCT